MSAVKIVVLESVTSSVVGWHASLLRLARQDAQLREVLRRIADQDPELADLWDTAPEPPPLSNRARDDADEGVRWAEELAADDDEVASLR